MINFPNQVGQPVNYGGVGYFNPQFAYQAMYSILQLLMSSPLFAQAGGQPIGGQPQYAQQQQQPAQTMFGQPMYGQLGTGVAPQQYFLPNMGTGFMGLGNMMNSYLGGMPTLGQFPGYAPGFAGGNYNQFANNFAQPFSASTAVPAGTNAAATNTAAPYSAATAVPAGTTNTTPAVGGEKEQTAPLKGNAAPIGDDKLAKDGKDAKDAIGGGDNQQQLTGNVGKMWDVWFDYEVDGEVVHKEGRPNKKHAKENLATDDRTSQYAYYSENRGKKYEKDVAKGKYGGKGEWIDDKYYFGEKEPVKGGKDGKGTPKDPGPKRKSPIILDLNGDGKPGITGANILGDGKIDGQPVEFNIDPTYDGKEKTEWLAANSGDGFLVWDVDGDGQITSSKELFGNYCKDGTEKFADGYEKLAHYFDKDGNGIIEGDELQGLQIWMDENGDGVTDPGELKSLSDFGINQLDVRNIDYSDYSSSFSFEGDKIPKTAPQETNVTAPETGVTPTTTANANYNVAQPAQGGLTGLGGFGNNYFTALLQNLLQIFQLLMGGQFSTNQ
jgi:hypothetical protein